MPMFSESYIQQVNDASDIVDVVGEYVKLKKAGSEFVGLCPFHNEKSGSFSVSSEKSVFICRGCGESGNTFQFLMKTQGYSFQESVIALAKKAGIPPPSPGVNDQNKESGRKAFLQDILETAQKLYQAALQAPNEDARRALEYIKGRGVTNEMIEKFGIGYSPSDGGLRNKINDVMQKDLIDAGLIYKSEYYGGEMREWMNQRIVFPIYSPSGKPIAFGGRAMSIGAKAKYINTPETLLFKKGSELFGQYQASNSIRREGIAIVTEGYLDVVVPCGAGVTNSVASMGTAFSEESLKKLFKMADTVVFCFDGDAPGRAAALRAMKTAASVIDEKKSCKFAFLPDGLDPDDYVRSNGAQSYKSLIEQADPMSRFMVKHFSSKNDISYAEGKASFARDCMDVVERINSPILKALMTEEIRSVVGKNIPLPGVTPGLKSIVPVQIDPPRRSALRAFRDGASRSAESTKINGNYFSSHQIPTLKPNAALNVPEKLISQVSTVVDLKSEIFDGSVTCLNSDVKNNSEEPQEIIKTKKYFRFRDVSERTLDITPTTMIQAARDASQNVPSQALRLLAFILREPALAESHIDATQFTGEAHEIAALSATAYSAMPEENKLTPASQTLVADLLLGPYGKTIERAVRLPEFLAKDMDAVAEASAIVWRAAQRVERSVQASRMRNSRPK